jgi:hypothetical protein
MVCNYQYPTALWYPLRVSHLKAVVELENNIKNCLKNPVTGRKH